jgi:hypothetical protein
MSAGYGHNISLILQYVNYILQKDLKKLQNACTRGQNVNDNMPEKHRKTKAS